jgi:uncharacterized protein YjiS (DUF1127 family)
MVSRVVALPRSSRVPIGLRIVLATARLVRTIAVEFQHRRAIRHLHQLDDRMLADVGIRRSEIEPAVRTGRHGSRGSISSW